MTLSQRIDAYEKLMRLDKPIGILLLLWPTLWGLWFARRGVPNFDILLIFFAGTVLMRSAGCVVNDFADRKFDPHVERTRDRPLASGLIKPPEALALAAILMLAAFALVLQLNRLTVMLSFAAVALAVVYPFLKRYFSFPQAWLGIAFGFGIPMAFAAQQGRVPAVAWVLLIANIFWAIAYDTEYAMVDRDDDRRIGVKSSALLLGRYDVLGIMAAHAAFLVLMAGVGWWQRLGVLYFCGVAAAAVLTSYQFRLIRGRDRNLCFQAFLHNNWVGLAIFTGLALDLHFRVRLFS